LWYSKLILLVGLVVSNLDAPEKQDWEVKLS